MSTFILCKIFIAILCSVSVYGILQAPDTETLSLSNYNQSLTNGQAFHKYSELHSSSELIIKITDVPSVVSFIIIQVHTQELDITLSSNKSERYNIFGYNVGLMINSSDILDARISVKNDNIKNVDALIAAVAYRSNAPIPGGCNMEFNVETAPSQRLNLTEATIIIEAQPASAPIINTTQLPCEQNSITYQSYRLYISEGDFTNETYFSTLKKMLTVDGIKENGELSGTILTSTSRVYSAYPGTGSIYALIATFNNSSVAYVPSFSYACPPVSNSQTCYILKNSSEKFVCALVFFIGVFFVFYGCRCFPLEISLFSSITSGMISYIILNTFGILDFSWHIGLTIFIGLLVGIYCTVSWGMENLILPTVQALSVLGTLIASILYFGIPDNPVFRNDVWFWSIYVAVCLVVPLVMCICLTGSIMICYSILGAYAMILPFDYWLGSNLKYIIINTIRRINVAGYNVAIINPPFQTTDVVLSVVWLILSLLGMYMHILGKNAKLPCPPATKYVTIVCSARKLVPSAIRNSRRVLPLGKNDSVCCSIS